MLLVLPECLLVVTMSAVILVPFLNRRSVTNPTLVTIVGLGSALLAAIFTTNYSGQFIFSSMLAIDPFSQFFKSMLLLFTLMVVLQWLLLRRDEVHPFDVPDLMCLLLGAAVGMALMASANNLLMIFVATETASLTSFSLAGFRKQLKVGSEGSLKYAIFGAASSAVMIYGMSLIYGTTGSLNLHHIAEVAASQMSPLLAVGLAGMLAGIAFKLSAVPFHFWCPDVFEGAPIEVTTFLSVASKGAALCMLLRVLSAFGDAGTFVGLTIGVGILGAITATWGNLAAFHQNNYKRLLAYSSIAHSGYMIMAASVAAVAGNSYEAQKAIAGALLFYILVYMFMNLGAFTIGALIANRTGSEDITDYAGMSSRSPLLAFLLALFLLSLFGLPGLGGFMGKVLIGAGMFKAGDMAWALVAVLLVNTLISLYYYLRPIYFMYLIPDTEHRPHILPRATSLAMLVICAAALIYTGLGGSTQDTADLGLLTRPTDHAKSKEASSDRQRMITEN